MFKKQKLVSIIALIAGLILTSAISLTIFYAKMTIDSVSSSDKSMLFWGSPMIIIGLAIAIFGIILIKISIHSLKNEEYYKKHQLLLIIIPIIVLCLAITSFIKNNNYSDSQQSLDNNIKTMYKINDLIVSNNNTGFDLLIKTDGQATGRYNLQIIASNQDINFLEINQAVSLSDKIKDIKNNISYKDLFKKCFTEFDRSKVYVCTENTMADATINIKVKLTLIQANNNKIEYWQNSLLSTNKEIKIKLETFAKNGEVTVNKFQVLNNAR